MANMTQVNQYIKANFPGLDIEAVKSDGFVYFGGDDGFGKVRSIFRNPRTTSTEDMVDMCLENIDEYVRENS